LLRRQGERVRFPKPESCPHVESTLRSLALM
jgi:hypothetical protein